MKTKEPPKSVMALRWSVEIGAYFGASNLDCLHGTSQLLCENTVTRTIWSEDLQILIFTPKLALPLAPHSSSGVVFPPLCISLLGVSFPPCLVVVVTLGHDVLLMKKFIH